MDRSVKVAIFSVDPPGLTTFHSFDPDSFTVISAVNDALIYIDNEGDVQPALATSWRRICPLEMEFTLRKGIRFHNEEPFDADAVVATFHAHKHPHASAGGKGVLAPIVGATKVDDFTVRIKTTFPDSMLLRRLFFSSIYPASVLAQHGRDALANHPIGTGPYRFVSYQRGHEIVLQRNPEHWAQKATVERIRFPILRQKEWLDRLQRGEIDVALNIDSHDRVRAGRLSGVLTASRPAAVSQWFLLSQHGPLADLRVRQALNHAINRRLLVDVTAHGYGAAQRSIATEGQQGFTECEPYRYSPELARRLLDEAGCSGGMRLTGLVSETSTAVYFMVKEFLARVGVELEAEIVPRGEWLARIVGGNLSGKPYTGDFALAMFDNPILHTLFHHFIFLFSHGPFSLLHDEAYDREFLRSATTLDEACGNEALAALERYARDQALVLFTMHEQVHAAFRPGFSCELPRSGHFQVASLMTLRVDVPSVPGGSLPPAQARHDDSTALLDATSHTGAFYLKAGTHFSEPVLRRVWDNLVVSEQRWRLESEPMVRELVSAAELRANLANVLSSTERVAIVGYSAEGRRLFANRGYELMLGEDGDRALLDYLGPRLDDIHRHVRGGGAWVGSVHLSAAGRPRGAPERLYLSVTRALDEEGLFMGHTFVLSDFSGEEERIRNQAIRTILDNVPYGLFMCDAGGRVLEGYSDACKKFFVHPSAGIAGRLLVELLGMEPRNAADFSAAYGQVFDDVLPEEVNLGNLPDRIAVGTRTYSLAGAVVRNEPGELATGTVQAVIFTLIDISDLTAAEHELELLRGVIQVMRHRSSFADFASDLHQKLLELAGRSLNDADQRLVRQELHTAKGVFGQFGMHDLARRIHRLEDLPVLTGTDLVELDDRLHDLLTQNEALWGIRLERRDTQYSTTESALAAMEASVMAASSADELRRVALACLGSLRAKTVGDLIGPLEESCRQHAERLGKRVRLEIHGAEVRCPPHLTDFFAVLPHLVRNSIDHGVEPLGERKEKPELATIRLDVTASEGGMRITLSDDGRGIATERVVRRALELGAVTEAQLARMTTADKLALIFVSGLSTARELSTTAGRGVGMSAVKSTVESLGGQLSLRSEEGQGTKLQIWFGTHRAS
ncbi:MAG: gsiB [Myxococcaceae bacterium]|nr:gsiB [Myxococcaceae bacterium]